ncbi:helix-turn-helix domain-containing protein [Spirochaeta dissipatitropha]
MKNPDNSKLQLWIFGEADGCGFFLRQSAFFCDVIEVPPLRKHWGQLAALAPAAQITPQGIGYVLRYGSLDQLAVAEQLGMDDFISSPIDQKELLYRLKRIRQIFSFNSRTDPELSRMENSVLHILRSSRGLPVQRTLLFELCTCDPSSRCIDMCISRLRKHLCEQGSDEEIRTLRGVGYILI